ncbi:MAG: SsrA-binding protein SmpB, partial [Rubrobacteraceae bacterium]|nr:SsrA-binding protein SmpB [Rubrobacteraceae bacterium]
MVGARAERRRHLQRRHRRFLQGGGQGSRRVARRTPAHAAGRVEGGETIVTDFARNRKALHDFAIEETYEAGIQLTGPEVKSVREGRANLKESYARVRDGEVFLIGAHISPYANARQERQLPTRDRKLLLHRNEIDRLIGKGQEEGKTLIPLKLYSKNGIVKLQIAVASRKRQYDKRREIAKKTADREIERAMKERLR